MSDEKQTKKKGGPGRDPLPYDVKRHQVEAYISGLAMENAGGKRALRAYIEKHVEEKFGKQ